MKGVMITDKRRNIVKKMLLVILSLCIFVIGCDDMSKPAMDVIADAVSPPTEPTPEAVPPIEVSEPEIPAITFENALNLIPGQRYRFRPTGITRSSSGAGDALIWGVEWGNVLSEQFLERGGFPADAPKIRITFNFQPTKPYGETLDGKPVIEYETVGGIPLSDEIVVEVTSEAVVFENQGGARGDRFNYTSAHYTGVAIENLTHPDRKFEYNGAPPISLPETSEAEDEVLELTFGNAQDLMPGKRYRFRPTFVNWTNATFDDKEALISTIHWGTVLYKEPVKRADFPDDVPKIELRVHPDPAPYYYMLDGKPVIEHEFADDQTLPDEIVVEITHKNVDTTSTAGERGNKYTYIFVSYGGVVIANLTHPDRVFEYD